MVGAAKLHALMALSLCGLMFSCSDTSFQGNSAAVSKKAESAPNSAAATSKPSNDPLPVKEPTSLEPVSPELPAADVPAVDDTKPVLDAKPSVEATIAKIPGVAVLKVGVNFEDSRSGDGDFNDAVLCFAGGFKVDATKVISTAKQQVIGTTSSKSGCTNQVSVVIVSAAGAKKPPITYDAKLAKPVPLNFEIGDSLEVTMLSANCDQGIVKTMHDMRDAKVLPDVCNTTGK